MFFFIIIKGGFKHRSRILLQFKDLSEIMFTMKEIPTYVGNKTYVITAQIITCKILSEKQETPILDGI